MNCRKANSLLSACIDGELTGVEQLHVRNHLRECDRCSAEYESLLQTKRLISTISFREPANSLENRIQRRVANSAAGPLGRARGWWSLLTEPDRSALRAGTAFAVVAVVAVLWMQLSASPPGRSTPLMAGVNRPDYRPSASNVPVGSYVLIHDNGRSSVPMSDGAMAVPVPAVDARMIPGP